MSKIIKEIENDFGIKVEIIYSVDGARHITEDDLAIINSHNFERCYFEKNLIICRRCFAEGEFVKTVAGKLRFDGFYDGQGIELEYVTCEQRLMNKACE